MRGLPDAKMPLGSSIKGSLGRASPHHRALGTSGWGAAPPSTPRRSKGVWRKRHSQARARATQQGPGPRFHPLCSQHTSPLQRPPTASGDGRAELQAGTWGAQQRCPPWGQTGAEARSPLGGQVGALGAAASPPCSPPEPSPSPLGCLPRQEEGGWEGGNSWRKAACSPAAWGARRPGACGLARQFLFNRKRNDSCFILSPAVPASAGARRPLLCRGTPVLSTAPPAVCLSNFHLHPPLASGTHSQMLGSKLVQTLAARGGVADSMPGGQQVRTILGWSGRGDTPGVGPLGAACAGLSWGCPRVLPLPLDCYHVRDVGPEAQSVQSVVAQSHTADEAKAGRESLEGRVSASSQGVHGGLSKPRCHAP